MAIKQRKPRTGGVVHVHHRVQFHPWAFTNKIRSAGLMPSFGSIGDAYDNATMESFWSTMQIELLNRKKWKTRIEFASAIFDYNEVLYTRQRRLYKINKKKAKNNGQVMSTKSGAAGCPLLET
jgi:transposase InsO family protein